ncbi:MAG: bifunctional diaminohydroxyphosphoribosylaminopyrimidine deaminase/5-amino-6-(5-phosphoribosylamino)uracil reductase RibD [Polaromonas sp.]|nr:bifunctional diaminohydroxyphosphoribosylaminopyrimidine deaminase/5-amino-6-(5-phosphoribosylamino)uracil reductase RibD [Polaromonas sp.]
MLPIHFPAAALQEATAQALQATLVSDPNPRVGCVIVDARGRTLGQGHTQAAGLAHAEIMALRAARAAGFDVRGATACVTLEPCSHHGRTPPCCDALIEAGVHRVLVARQDPNPLVAGRGIARLRAAGIEVSVLDADDPAALATRELNIGFFSRMIRKTPWVRMKVAASLDGKTALNNGASQWITSEAARTDGHAWRARASAVLTGIGTVLQDNPRLDVRLVATKRQPHLVVVDSRLETPLDAHLFMAGRALYIYAAEQNDAKKSALEARGATVIYLSGVNGKVDLAAMLRDLARREVNELHVEAGHKLNGSLIREGLVDEFVVYLAPKLIGQGSGMASFGPISELSQAIPLEFKSIDMLGPDLRILARIPGREQF